MKKMRRLPNWRERLINFIGANARAPYEEGVWDCALFTAGAVQAMTGVDLAKRWRGYASISDGVERLRAAGLADHVDLAARILPERLSEGAPWPASARPGDVAVVPVAEGEALGIVQGERIYLLSPRGLTTAPLRAATRVFEV